MTHRMQFNDEVKVTREKGMVKIECDGAIMEFGESEIDMEFDDEGNLASVSYQENAYDEDMYEHFLAAARLRKIAKRSRPKKVSYNNAIKIMEEI